VADALYHGGREMGGQPLVDMFTMTKSPAANGPPIESGCSGLWA
jgi:hypothetical protein